MAARTAHRMLECLSESIADYPEGIILPIDKPYRWTSADVIRKVKFAAFRHFHKKNLKVGHAGTLDPLATGVLLVCIGPATKLAEELQRHDKEYVAGISFGATTPSYDLEKEIDRLYPHDQVTEDAIKAVLPSFLGEQEQVAPLFSAKSVDGVRAYELARRAYKEATREGKSFDHADADLLTRQRIRIDEIELLAFSPGRSFAVAQDDKEKIQDNKEKIQDNKEIAQDDKEKIQDDKEKNQDEKGASSRINVTDNSALGLPHADIRIACSKGTYIRAFARDLGEALGTGAHLDALCRTRTGGFRIEDALTLDQALQLLQSPS